MRKIEAQAGGLDDAACLLHVLAQHIAQRGVQQMRGGVIAHGRLALDGSTRGVQSKSLHA